MGKTTNNNKVNKPILNVAGKYFEEKTYKLDRGLKKRLDWMTGITRSRLNNILELLLANLLCLLCLLCLAACGQTPAQQISETARLTPQPTPSQSPLAVESPTPNPPLTPQPTATPRPTENPLSHASEIISKFTLINDFSQPFNPADWTMEDPETDDTFAYATRYGILQVKMNGEIFGTTNRFMALNNDLFTDQVNGISIDLPYSDSSIKRSYAGVFAEVNDGKVSTLLRCGLERVNISARYVCDIFDREKNSVFRQTASMDVPVSRAYRVEIEWQPDTGLALFFLDDHLMSSYALTAGGPVQVKSAGLFIERTNPYDDGTWKFANLRLGSYQPSVLNLPDDLIPQRSDKLQNSTNAIDYYLLDDFNDPLNDGFLDMAKWNTMLRYDENTPISGSMLFMQNDGALSFQGTGEIQIDPKDPPGNLRAIQADVLPPSGTVDKETVSFTLMVDKFNFQYLRYTCNLGYSNQQFGNLECMFLENDEKFLHLTESIPVRVDEPVTINLSYNEPGQILETRINGLVVDQAAITNEQKTLIKDMGIQANLVVRGVNDLSFVRLDNCLYGVKKSKIDPLPTATRAPVIALLPHSELYLYDDFEDQDYDGLWDFSRWSGIKADIHGGFFQRDGALITKYIPVGEIGAWKVNASQYTGITYDQANAIQVTVNRGQPTYNSSVTVIIMFAGSGQGVHLNRNGGVFSCSMNYDQDKAFMECGCSLPNDNCMDYHVGPLDMDPSLPHQAAIEWNPLSGTFYAYLDGVLVTSFDRFGHLGTFVFDLQAQSDNPESIDEVRLEEVLIGRYAEHPEVLKTPEKTAVPQ